MKDILFITPNLSSSVKHEINGTMLLGTLLLADGFDVQILRYSEIDGYMEDYPRFIDNFVEKILAHKPKCVSFYTIWTDFHIVLRLCKQLWAQAPEITLVLGGPQSSFVARETLEAFPEVDFVCTGEGENTVIPFFRRMLREEGAEYAQIPGLYYRDGDQIRFNNDPIPLTDLNTLPDWDDRLLLDRYTGESEKRDPYLYYMPIDVGRGCPFNCTFCSTSAFWHRTCRLKKVDRVIQDICYFRDKFGYRSFLLSHDALTANKQMVHELCDKILENDLNIHWECSTRVDCLTVELLEKMKKAGCKTIHMGIETGSERMQKLTRKNLDLSKARSILQTILSLRIYPVLFFVFGIPGETEDDLNDTLELIFDLCDQGAPNIQLILCMFTPGADLLKDCYDDLYFDPHQQTVSMSKFGCWDEVDMISSHKALFSTFYQLHTPVRDNYPFAKYFSLMYQRFPKAARFARWLYHGDNLAFYRDFHNNNPQLLKLDIASLEKKLEADCLEIFLNTLKNCSHPAADQVRELLRFEADCKKIRAAQNGAIILETYGFSYKNFTEKSHPDQFSQGTTQFLLKKDQNKFSASVVHIG